MAQFLFLARRRRSVEIFSEAFEPYLVHGGYLAAINGLVRRGGGKTPDERQRFFLSGYPGPEAAPSRDSFAQGHNRD